MNSQSGGESRNIECERLSAGECLVCDLRQFSRGISHVRCQGVVHSIEPTICCWMRVDFVCGWKVKDAGYIALNYKVA